MSAEVIPFDDPKPRAKVIAVDPPTAERWLGRNQNNRSIREAIVAAYVRDIKAGKFLLNGETIKFDRSGVLLDGQHRLMAVVKSGETVLFTVVTGLDSEVRKTIDVGAKRSYADELKMRGENNWSALAAVARRCFMWSRGVKTNVGKIAPTSHELDEFLDEWPELRWSAELATRAARSSLIPSSVLGLAHWLFSQIDRDEADWFIARVGDGAELPARHPIATLREKVKRMRIAGGRVHETDALAFTIRAWNAHRQGVTRKAYVAPSEGFTSDNFPEPK